jgi:hypothetical protein
MENQKKQFFKKLKKNASLALGWGLLILSSHVAQARGFEGASGWMLSANVAPFQTKNETGSTVNQDFSVSGLDANFGLIMESGLYLGVLYGSSTVDDQALSTKPSLAHYGASLGFHSGGFFIHGHYLASAEIKKATATSDRTDGTGTQFDVGYIVNISGPFFLGGQVTSRTLEYKTLKTGSVEATSAHKVVDLYPSIRLTLIW